MNSKIFRSSFLTSLLVLISSVAIIMGILFEFFEKQIEYELKSEASYIMQAVENEGTGYFDGFSNADKRVTLIDSTGNVIYDNQMKVNELDNHADREEIKEAMENGTGKSIRYSTTLTEKTVYYAVKLSNGNILRVSTNQYTIFTIIMSLGQPIAIVLAIALILSIILSSRVSKAIIKPINDIDLDNPELNDTYEELAPLLKKIASQKNIINEQLNLARQKQKEFELITENMSEGFLIIDNEKNILTHNTAAVHLLGIDSISENNDFKLLLEKVLSGNKTISKMTQNDRTYDLIANPVYDEGIVIGAVIIIIDITENEKAEELRREFTANVSHELKTPLTSISGFAELMKDGGTPNEIVMDFSKSIFDEAQRLISLVSDIIKISELDEKSVKYEYERINLYDISNEIMEHLKASAQKRNITIRLFGNDECILGVRKIIYEMIYNLCDNAIKYNNDNGFVDIIIKTEKDRTSISVSDTGIGIPINHQKRVFERFYRVDKSHSKKIGGTGLGLAIVKHGAMFHDAELELLSSEGKGTTITLKFKNEEI